MNENDAGELVTALYDRWFTKLVAFAARATESHELAEDLAQDSFMQLYLAVRAGKDIEHPKAWTLCVLRRAMNRQCASGSVATRLMKRNKPEGCR